MNQSLASRNKIDATHDRLPIRYSFFKIQNGERKQIIRMRIRRTQKLGYIRRTSNEVGNDRIRARTQANSKDRVKRARRS